MLKRIKSWLFENRHTKQTIIKNTIWLSIGTIASRVIKAVVIIYAARILGAEQYGIFSYVLSVSALLSLFADLGMTPILTRELSREPESLEKILSVIFTIKLFLTGLSAVLVGVVAPFFVTINGAASLMPLAAILVIFDSLRDFSASITRAWERMEIEAGISMVTGVGITIFGLAAIFVEPTPLFLMVGYVAGAGLGLLLAVILLGKYLKNFWNLFDWEMAKRVIKDALPFALMGILNALTVNIDAVMIGWLAGAEAVGLYAAAQRPILLVYMASTLLAMSAFPTMAKLARKDDIRARSILERTTTASLLFAIPVFVGGAILAPQIVSFLFGAGYASAAPTFAVLLFTIIPVFFASNMLNATFAYNEQRIMMYSLFLGGAANVVLDYFLIRRFGIIGSAFATIVSQSAAYGLVWYKLKKINNFHTIRHLGKGIISTGIMCVVSYAMLKSGVHILANITISGIIYFGALATLKEKTVGELKSIFHLKDASAPSVEI